MSETRVSVRLMIEVYDADGHVECTLRQEEIMRAHPRGITGRMRKAADAGVSDALSVLRNGNRQSSIRERALASTLYHLEAELRDLRRGANE